MLSLISSLLTQHSQILCDLDWGLTTDMFGFFTSQTFKIPDDFNIKKIKY